MHIKFKIGTVYFDISTRPSRIKEIIKTVYADNLENRVAAIKKYRELTDASLKDAIHYFNDEIASIEHKVKINR